MSQLTALKLASTLSDVAALLGLRPALLSYNLYKKDNASKYVTFDIPKKYGGVRQISAPLKDLKLIQKRLSDLLQNCVHEIQVAAGTDDDGKRPDRIVHGFRRKRSIISNGRQHRRRRYVFNVDLEGFFDSINFGRVRGFLLKDARFALQPRVATVIAQIACHDNRLPQGSPCSPVIANLVGHLLDVHLTRLAAAHGCNYTRYADDLTFSTNDPDFATDIATCTSGSEHDWVCGKELLRLVGKSGFKINPQKTRMQYRDSRQEVSGLVVNRKVNVSKTYRDKVRAMVHRLLSIGSFAFEYKQKKGGITSVTKIDGQIAQLQGMLAFVEHVDKANRKLEKENGTAPHHFKREEVYQRFLLFSLFFSAKEPVVVCEGTTDNVYLLHAIRSLAALYPKLAAKDAQGEVRLKIRILKYVGTSTGDLLKMSSGGYGGLVNLIRRYCQVEKKHFKAPGALQPFIILSDNDDAAKDVFKCVKEITGKEITNADLFFHVQRNLYVVTTPNPPGKDKSMMEDLFHADTLATKVDGKTFNCSKEMDSQHQYGKTVFAHKVVKAKADSIDFGLFKPLLDNFVAVIDEHAKKVLTADLPAP